jgi:hypothetical protein
MKPHKSTILIMLLGLLLVAFVAVMAQQTPAQTPQTPPAGEQRRRPKRVVRWSRAVVKANPAR